MPRRVKRTEPKHAHTQIIKPVSSTQIGPDRAPIRIQIAVMGGLGVGAGAAHAAGKGTPDYPPIVESKIRCTPEALDLFADTRANFSQVLLSASIDNLLISSCDLRCLCLIVV